MTFCWLTGVQDFKQLLSQIKHWVLHISSLVPRPRLMGPGNEANIKEDLGTCKTRCCLLPSSDEAVHIITIYGNYMCTAPSLDCIVHVYVHKNARLGGSGGNAPRGNFWCSETINCLSLVPMQTPFSFLPRAVRGNELGYEASLVLRIKLELHKSIMENLSLRYWKVLKSITTILLPRRPKSLGRRLGHRWWLLEWGCDIMHFNNCKFEWWC